MGFLEKEVAGGFTVLHVGLAVVALIVLIVILKAVFGKKQETGAYMVVASCGKCGWAGDVSKYNPVCKQCGTKINN